ncbi:hypothetical protein [Okeania sp. SIO2B3]|uniref:hypothetical protein n=1 Tax=Okeania sp. SIO2B3 TaxID=2607784 RepID=UPI0013C24C8C|nr:hypothetical protein [Okeania sp. SIO2B3]NET45120.1 hypothetical protein [Okeania sp. SIO2B3]
MGRWGDGGMGGWGDGGMGGWGDGSKFQPAWSAFPLLVRVPQASCRRRGVASAFSPILVPEFPDLTRTEDYSQKYIPPAKIPLRGSIFFVL